MQERFKKTVGIIGGKGKTGSQFARIFRKLGFKVIVSDLGTRLKNSELIDRSDIVIFSVPLHLSEEIILREALGCKRKDQLVLDVSSLKEKQVKAMNKANGSVVGMHPLFGPSKRGFDELSIVLCPGRCSQKRLSDLKKLFEEIGMKVSVMTPKEHDKFMAVVQVIPHLKTILAGELLKEFGINPKRPYEISTPIYKLELDIIGRIFSQDANLYSAIIANNPYSEQLLKKLTRITETYSRDVAKGNLENLNKRFDGVKKFLGKFSDEAFCDSEKIINEMQKWK
ncbi:prephenate dehydrogenase/arogenate dehydrogenase family protein [Candidatus Peregrinibacteria bacterium]|nr:prephenate dehydrogenase/arogenate dehydrogenase family protein [Candidatus Peregrinibacteria bacterium]MBT4148155.1 prephenate dehydrogenase/arogenate dehydrogenase family protein [Candidatus Peregrinibacteria bacterium]MBT4366642.1 prephenate dehydrogenase/arogenate dehydrogenase family protein [Candidatus Peregrinibacteria bacterium]MBT4455629.1 prephenate dehydrogenase/arogenate dehydrogenase family protein [Candidatus Peregrinibacteria bacterium]